MTSREKEAKREAEGEHLAGVLSEEEWRKHVAAAERFQGSNVAYCRRFELDLKEFRFHKRRIRAAKRLAMQRPAFVKIAPAEAGTASKSHGRVDLSLPDPAWTAQFLVALLRGLR